MDSPADEALLSRSRVLVFWTEFCCSDRPTCTGGLAFGKTSLSWNPPQMTAARGVDTVLPVWIESDR